MSIASLQKSDWLDIEVKSVTAKNIASTGQFNTSELDTSILSVSNETTLNQQIIFKPVQFSVVGESMAQYDNSSNLLYQMPMTKPNVSEVLTAVDNDGTLGWATSGGGGSNSFTNTDGNIDITEVGSLVTINLNNDIALNDISCNTIHANNLINAVYGTSNQIDAVDVSGNITLSLPSSQNGLILQKNIITNNNAGANTSVGYGVLSNSTIASNCTGVGSLALNNIVSGTNETALGVQALNSDISGYNNTAVGQGASYFLTNGHDNVSVGTNAGSNCIGSKNVFIGSNSGASFTGNYNGTNNIVIGQSTTLPTGINSNCCVLGDGAVNKLSIGQCLDYGITKNNALYLGTGYTLPSSIGNQNQVLSRIPTNDTSFNNLSSLMTSTGGTLNITNGTNNLADLNINNQNLSGCLESTNSSVSISYDAINNKVNLMATGGSGGTAITNTDGNLTVTAITGGYNIDLSNNISLKQITGTDLSGTLTPYLYIPTDIYTTGELTINKAIGNALAVNGNAYFGGYQLLYQYGAGTIALKGSINPTITYYTSSVYATYNNIICMLNFNAGFDISANSIPVSGEDCIWGVIPNPLMYGQLTPTQISGIFEINNTKRTISDCDVYLMRGSNIQHCYKALINVFLDSTTNQGIACIYLQDQANQPYQSVRWEHSSNTNDYYRVGAVINPISGTSVEKIGFTVSYSNS